MKHTKWLLLALLVVLALGYFFSKPSDALLNSESRNRAIELIRLLEAHAEVEGEYPKALEELKGTANNYSEYEPVPIVYSRDGDSFNLTYQLLPMGPFREYDSKSSSWTFSE